MDGNVLTGRGPADETDAPAGVSSERAACYVDFRSVQRVRSAAQSADLDAHIIANSMIRIDESRKLLTQPVFTPDRLR